MINLQLEELLDQIQQPTQEFFRDKNSFANHPESKARGYKVGRFSFNVSGGRCEECQGAGVKTIEMNFLPDVHVDCEYCNGKRYNRENIRNKIQRQINC